MVNPSFLKLKKYLTLDEAGQYIAHHLRKKTAGNSEVLFLINEGLLSCYLDLPDTANKPLNPELERPIYKKDNDVYRVMPIKRHKVINPALKFSIVDYLGGVVYRCSQDKSRRIIGDCLAFLKNDIKLDNPIVLEKIEIVLVGVFGEYLSDGALVRFKVETCELIRVIEQLNPEDFAPHGDIARVQSPSQPDSLLTKELQQAKEEIARLNAQLLEMRATNSTFVIAGALIEMLTEQKTPRRNQTKIKLELEEKGLKGLSKSSLDNLFVDANKALKASKDAG